MRKMIWHYALMYFYFYTDGMGKLVNFFHLYHSIFKYQNKWQKFSFISLILLSKTKRNVTLDINPQFKSSDLVYHNYNKEFSPSQILYADD
jgi:hypothetical protein